MKIKFLLISILCLFSVLVIDSLPVLASGSMEPLVPMKGEQKKAYDTGNYTLNDLVQTGINITKIILGTVGSLALLMFVYGGIMMLISSGNSEKVSQAKGIIMAAVIGLVIIFTSYIIVRFVISALEGKPSQIGNWTNTGIEIQGESENTEQK